MDSKKPKPPASVTFPVTAAEVVALDAYGACQAVPPTRTAIAAAAFRRGLALLVAEATHPVTTAPRATTKRTKGRRS